MIIPQVFYQISAIVLIIALTGTLFSIIYKWKEIFSYFKKIPKSLFAITFFFVSWGFFLVPKNFSGRGEFGVWLMSIMNLSDWRSLLMDARAPIYHLRNRFFTDLFGGISYEFIAGLNFFGFFISIFLIYVLVKNFTKNNKAAYACSLFFLANPIIYTFSLTEDYSLLALFFMILSFFFLSIQFDTDDSLFLIPAGASALLATGSRVEYIFLPYLLILFYLFLIKARSYKVRFTHIFLFLIFLIPRTIPTVGMYFADAQHDVALHGRTYQYEGNPITYMIQIIIGASEFFMNNIGRALQTLSNYQNLTLILIILALFTIFFSLKKEKNDRRVIFFFFFQFLFLIFYYAFFHAVGGISAYRYMITILTPLIIVAGIGFAYILQKKDLLFYGGLQILIIFSFVTVLFPLAFRDYSNLIVDRQLSHFVNYDHDQVRREYYSYKNLSYENRISGLIQNEFDVSVGNNTYFITNGERNLLHAMPVDGQFIAINDVDQLKIVARMIPDNAVIYLSQSEMGFTSHMIDGYIAADPENFENELKRIFNVEEVLVSYEVDGHHAFLYRATK